MEVENPRNVALSVVRRAWKATELALELGARGDLKDHLMAAAHNLAAAEEILRREVVAAEFPAWPPARL